MIVAVLTLSVIALVELAVIVALINRLLAKCAVPPIELPKPPRRSGQDVKEDERRRIATIPFGVS